MLDFGLVKPLESTHPDHHLTGTAPGAQIGTLAYMSPEQRAGGAPAESWDIWALTVIAFEVLTGVHPFAVSADPRMVLAGAPVVSRPVPEIPLRAPAAAFFDRSLSTDPTRRPASVQRFIDELEGVL